MKSPARQASPLVTATYKCDDCGDVSHSQASLSLHRSVCHTSGKFHDISGSELIEECSDVIGKTEQIADACNCPKCGEHFLLLRENNFSCALCEFQDVDQERFFVHLKEHYEPHSILTVDPGSVIIEQVIDDTNDLGNRNDPDVCLDADNRRDSDDHDQPDDRDDPEYEPDNDNDDDDDDNGGDDDWEESKEKKRKLDVSKLSPKIVSTQKILDFVMPTGGKKLATKTPETKLGILWQQQKGAPKKLNFVKTPITPRNNETVKPIISRTSLKENSASVQKQPPASRKSVTVKKEPVSGDESDQADRVKTTKWVRLQDIKYVGAPVGSPTKSPWNASSGPSLRYEVSSKYAALRIAPRSRKGPSTPKSPNQASSGSSPSKGTESAEKPSADTEPNENAPKKTKGKKPKPPKEKKIKERKIPVCGVCKRVFSSSQALKTHLFIHTGEKNFSCEHCGKAFTQWSTCQQHIMSIHSGTKKFTCEYCGACFSRSSGMILHRRIHTGEVLHHCNICGKGFRAKSYLDRHRTLHTGEKRYKCEFCNKLFRTSTDMKRHRNSVHFGLGNVSLTQAREILQNKLDGYIRTPQRPSKTVIQRFVDENSSSDDDAEEVIRATTVIAGSQYEL